MAFVFHRNENLFVIYGETIIISNSSQEPAVLKNPEIKGNSSEEKDDSNQGPEENNDAKQDLHSSDQECSQEAKVLKGPEIKDTVSEETGDSKQGPDKKNDDKQEPLSPDKECMEIDEDNLEKMEETSNKSNIQDRSIICCCLSVCGNILAVADHAKRLIIWRRQSINQEWYISCNRTTKRKCIKLTFCESSQVILAADRAGDVYSFSCSQPLEPEKLLLGHLSMLLDMVITHDGKFIITSDRDEKIRVSHYPNTYNIQSYCLGHTEFVSAISLYSCKLDWLLSGSGDGTIRVWNYLTGDQLCSYSYTSELQDFQEKLSSGEPFKKIPAVSEIQVSEETGLLAVLFDKVPCVGLFILDSSTSVPKLTHRQFVTSSAEPWDIEISVTSGQLFVLCPTEGDVLTVLSSTRDKPESEITFQNMSNAEADTPIAPLKNMLKLHWDSIKECTKRDDFQHLYKQWFDNMKVYLEKKELREQEKVNRRKKSKVKK